MSKGITYLIILVIFLTLVICANYFVFNIYETEFKLSHDILYRDKDSVITLNSVAVNALGLEAPFRKSKTFFQLIEGAELVEIVAQDTSSGKIVLKVSNGPGKISLLSFSEQAFLPGYHTIDIR